MRFQNHFRCFVWMVVNENILTNKKIKFPSETEWRPELWMLMQFRSRHGSIFTPVSVLLNTRTQKMAVTIQTKWYWFTNLLYFRWFFVSLNLLNIWEAKATHVLSPLYYNEIYNDNFCAVKFCDQPKTSIRQNSKPSDCIENPGESERNTHKN